MKKENATIIKRQYTIGEEIANAITHGIGTGLSIAALVLLTVKAVHRPDLSTTSYIIFGASLIVLYLFSTLYHSLPLRAKKVFGIFDHVSIYILIAGTYTPFCLSFLRGWVGWTIFGVIWGLAVLGIVLYSIFGSRIKIISVVMYIIMGWLIMMSIKKLRMSISPTSMRLLLFGGIVYTSGCVFYSLKKVKWMHTVWHLFVMGGSILHFFALYLY